MRQIVSCHYTDPGQKTDLERVSGLSTCMCILKKTTLLKTHRERDREREGGGGGAVLCNLINKGTQPW